MTSKLDACFAAAPATEKGKATQLSSDAKGGLLVYYVGNLVMLRGVQNPQEVKIYTGHQTTVSCAKISPSGFYVASGDISGNVRIWATNNEDLTLKLETKALGGAVNDIAWSPDNERLVVVGNGTEKFGTVFLVNSGSSVGEITGHSRSILTCDYRPERPFRIITGGEDNLACFYEGPPFKFVKSSQTHANFVNCVRYSADGAFAASVSSDKKLVLYDGKTGEQIKAIDTDHKGSIYSCAWSKDNKFLLTASADKSSKLWSPEGTLIATFQLDAKSAENMVMGCTVAGAQPISLTLNGDLIYNNVEDPANPKLVVRGHQKPVTNVIVGGDWLFTSSSDGHILKWALDGSAHRFAGKGHTSSCTALAYANGALVSVGLDDSVIFHNVETNTTTDIQVKVKGGASGVVATAVGVVVITSGAVYVISPNGQIKSEVKAAYNPTCVAHANGVVAVGAKDKTIHIYRLEGETLKEVTVITEHKSPISSIAFAASGTKLASGDTNRQLILWEVNGDSFTNVREFLGAHTAAVKSVQFSSSETLLASAGVDSAVIVYNLESGDRIPIQRAHAGGANSVAFLGNERVASVGNDSCVRVWTWAF